MPTSDERSELRFEPLPPEPTPGIDILKQDEVIPTRIAIVDKEIATLEAEIHEKNESLQNLRSSRAILLDHAIKIGCMEDDHFRIDKVVKRGDRIADPAKLAKFTTEWKLYEAAIVEKAKRDATDVLLKAKSGLSTKINLGIADKIFGKKSVDSCSEMPETVTYKVVKKE